MNWYKIIHIKLNRSVKAILFTVGMFFIIGFSYNRQSERRVKNVFVHIDHTTNKYFVEESDILNLMTDNGQDPIVDKKYQHLRLKEVEKKIKTLKFVQDAQVSKDHKGNLKVLVQQRRPIARIETSGISGVYICSDGATLSTSPKFTSRVLILDGDYSSHLASNEFLLSKEGKAYLDVLNFIDNNKFWRAQVAHLDINKYGEITITPQVGGQIIEFGLPEDIETKFRNAELFYKKIIPSKGWNAYSKVNVKFKNQIICTK